MKIKYNSLKCFLISCIFIFSDILGGGNLNLTYLLGLLMIIPLLYDRQYFKRLIFLWVPLIVIAVLSKEFSGISQNNIKLFVYLAKLFLCITLMYGIEKNFRYYDYYRIYNNCLNLIIILLFISLICNNNSTLWRLNDPYNDFSKIRLQLLFTEPSVLGLLTGVMTVFGVYSFMQTKIMNIEKIRMLLLMVTLILTFSMSGIMYTLISCTFLIVMMVKKSLLNRKLKDSEFAIYIVVAILLIYIFLTDNVISRRLIAIITGNDGSFNFRWRVSYNSLGNIMQKTNYFGLGMGNMNTNVGASILLSEGVDHFFSNSFMYFIAENGVPGLLYIIYLFVYIIRLMLKNRDIKNPLNLKISLLIFVFVSQIAGGYFTDPFIWCLYGFIGSASVNTEQVLVFKKKLEERK